MNADELIQTARALAQRLLAKHAERRLDEELEDAIQGNAHQRSAEDFKEGVQAFSERRTPNWPSAHAKVESRRIDHEFFASALYS